MTKREVAERLRKSVRSVENLVATGKLVAVNVNASGKKNLRALFKESDVEAFIEDSRVVVKAAPSHGRRTQRPLVDVIDFTGAFRAREARAKRIE